MVEADPPMRAARNAFLVLVTLLLGISTYQFLTIDGITRPVAVLWVVSVLTYFGSKFYYDREETATTGDDESSD